MVARQLEVTFGSAKTSQSWNTEVLKMGVPFLTSSKTVYRGEASKKFCKMLLTDQGFSIIGRMDDVLTIAFEMRDLWYSEAEVHNKTVVDIGQCE